VWSGGVENRFVKLQNKPILPTSKKCACWRNCTALQRKSRNVRIASILSIALEAANKRHMVGLQRHSTLAPTHFVLIRRQGWSNEIGRSSTQGRQAWKESQRQESQNVKETQTQLTMTTIINARICLIFSELPVFSNL
jgi:hypothetical protein